MPDWLVIYLIFAVSGGVTTFYTILMETNILFEEITEGKADTPAAIQYPVITFMIWLIISIVMAPIWAFIIITGELPKYRLRILKGWLENAGFND